MQLVTVRSADRIVWGVLDGSGDRVADLTDHVASPTALVAAACADPAAVMEAAAGATRVAFDRYLPPVPTPARIMCIGVNYAEHARETGRSPDPQPYPTLFVRFASSLVGHGEPIVVPAASEQLDYEGELAVVIGRTARDVAVDEALDHIAGYSCFLDGSVRDFQRHTTQFTPGKNFDRSGAWGPWITTADELGDPSALRLTTIVSGEVLQDASTEAMIHDVAAAISYCSTFTTLEPGDVIATGTPSGVGAARTPPRWLAPGDVVEVEIERVGRLSNPVAAEVASTATTSTGTVTAGA